MFTPRVGVVLSPTSAAGRKSARRGFDHFGLCERHPIA
jgi:hypothetical protein